MTLRSLTRWVVAMGGAGLGLAGAACDEAIPFALEVRGSPDAAGADTSAADIPTVDGPCPIADDVFTPYCVECHEGTKHYPDLRAGALGRLAGATALAYPGQTLVVAGNSGASLLFTKLHAGTGIGALMPPDGALSQGLLDEVAAWIDGGAAACTGVVDPGPTEPPIPTPGGTITFTATAANFQTTKPSWAESGTCTSQSWWKFEGDTESGSMHPGRDCIDCHDRDEEAPGLAYAGTVYPNVADTDDCRGVKGVKVEILDEAGATIASTTTNTGGNFYWRTRDLTYRSPYRARLSFDGRTREMTLPVSTDGDCNTCHGTTGSNGAPGRMVAP